MTVLPILLSQLTNHFCLGNLHRDLCLEVGGVILKEFSHAC